MTREQFKKIEEEHGFMEAINMFAEECDDIHTTSMLEDRAKEMIDMGYYGDAEGICYALRTVASIRKLAKENYTDYWIYSFGEGEIIPIDSIEDIEDLFE